MTVLVRNGLLAFSVSLGSLGALAACGSNDAAKGGSPAAGGAAESDSGTGGTSDSGAGGTSSAGTGGASDSGAGGASDSGAGGTDGGNTTGPRTIKAADGGTITADGLVLDIPPGALAADTDITVVVSDGTTLPAAATLVAKVYDLGPNGTTFTKPVKLTIDVDAAKLGTKNPVVSYLDTGSWVALSDSASVAATVVATTTHFTPFGVVGVDAAACNAMVKAACQTCCKTAFANGAGEAEPLANAIKYCGCTAGGPCETDCTSNVCVGQAPSTTCQTCLSTAGSAVPQSACITQGQTACAASPTCTAYTNCALSCP